MFGGDTWWMKNFGKKRVCLDTAYFIKTKKLIIESTVDKGKNQLNQYSGGMNSTKKCRGSYKIIVTKIS